MIGTGRVMMEAKGSLHIDKALDVIDFEGR